MVATVVANRIPNRISHLLYLDAFVPRDGDCLLDLLPREIAGRMRDSATREGNGWRVPPNPLPPDTSREDVEWMLPLRGMQPIATFEQPARFGPHPKSIQRTYIYCKRAAPGDVFRVFLESARSDAGWRNMEMDASHSPHVTAIGRAHV